MFLSVCLISEILDQLYHRVIPKLKEGIKKKETAKTKMKSGENVSSSEDDPISDEDDEWY